MHYEAGCLPTAAMNTSAVRQGGASAEGPPACGQTSQRVDTQPCGHGLNVGTAGTVEGAVWGQAEPSRSVTGWQGAEAVTNGIWKGGFSEYSRQKQVHVEMHFRCTHRKNKYMLKFISDAHMAKQIHV